MEQTEKEKKPGIHYAWFVAIGCCFMMAGGLGAVLDAGIGVFLRPVLMDPGISFAAADPAMHQSELMIFMSCYFLSSIIAMPLVGYIMPRFNLRIVLTVCFILTAAAFGLSGTYTASWQWWISGAVYGLAGSFIFVMPVPILIGNWFFKSRGLVLGIVSCFSGIGGMLLAPLFTFFVNEIGWRNAYFAAAILICCMVLPFTIFVFRFKPQDMGLKPWGWSEEEEKRQKELSHSSAAIADANTGVKANKAAVLSVTFICMFLICGLVSFYGTLGTLMNPFAASLGFFDTEEANRMFGATLVSAIMLGNITSKIVMGFVTDRIGVFKSIIIQLCLVIVGLTCFLFFKQAPWLLFIWGFLFGIQNSVYAVSTPLLIRSLFGNRDYAAIFSWCRIGTGAIGFIGGPLFGYLVAMNQGAYDYCFIAAIAIGIICIIAIFLAESQKKKLVWVNGEDDPSVFQASISK